MKASVIIPMYNEERYISRCLESLKKQTFKNFETILIDDGSTDKTVEIASKYDVTILKQEHGGPGKARNWGAKEAKGDVLVFVDADMFFDPKYIEMLMEPIISGSEIGTSHGTELVGNLENPIARAFGAVRGVYDPNFPRSGIYRAIRKADFLAAGGFDSSRGYFDDDLSKVNGGKGALFVEKAVCYHNNPEKFAEIYKHSAWVGKGLMQSGAIGAYAKKYSAWIAAFSVLAIVSIYWAAISGRIAMSGIAILLSLFILMEAKAVQRTLKEGCASHLAYVPVVMSLRGLGYAKGIINYMVGK